MPDELLYRVVDVLDEIAEDTGRSVPQTALNWLLQRPTVASVIVGARDEQQLRQSIGTVGWSLTPDQVARLDAASAKDAAYPYFPYQRQAGFAQANPSPVPLTSALVRVPGWRPARSRALSAPPCVCWRHLASACACLRLLASACQHPPA